MQVAVIGHGKSPEGRGWGERIDACDAVVRMWDCHWQSIEDYGSRYDIGLFEVHAAMIADFNRYREREPERGWVGSILGPVERSKLPENVDLVDPAEWVQIARAMGGIGATGRLAFTRGAIAACWTLEGMEKGDTLTLVGFDNVYERVALPVADGFPEAYVTAPSTFTFSGYAPGKTKYGNHDFGIERPLLEKLAAIRGVKLAFAQDVWTRRRKARRP